MTEEFDILAAKAIAGEASPAEGVRLNELLMLHPELSEELAQLQATWQMVREADRSASASGASAYSIPPHRLRQLEETVRERFRLPGGDTARKELRELERSPMAPGQATTASTGASLLGFLREVVLGRMRPAGAVWVAGAALAVFVITTILISRSRYVARSASPSQEATAGYAITIRGTLELQRHRQRTSVQGAAALLSPDELILARGTAALLIVPAGITELQGPQHLTVAALSRLNGSIVHNAGTNTVPNPIQPTLKSFQAILFPQAALPIPEGLLVTTRGGRSIPVYSPLGTTAHLSPSLLWKAEPGKSYDLIINDALATSQRVLYVTGVSPPLEWNQIHPPGALPLATNGLYNLTIEETGKPFTASEYSFRTLQEQAVRPGSPPEKLAEAYRLLCAHPDQIGDALADLMTLPPDLARSELALRLKLFAFGQAGYQDDYEAVAATLKALLALP